MIPEYTAASLIWLAGAAGAAWWAGTLAVTAAVLAGMIAEEIRKALLAVLTELWTEAWDEAAEWAGGTPDAAALAATRLPIIVLDLWQPNSVERAILGQPIGTLVSD